jgi:hypothetical protein
MRRVPIVARLVLSSSRQRFHGEIIVANRGVQGMSQRLVLPLDTAGRSTPRRLERRALALPLAAALAVLASHSASAAPHATSEKPSAAAASAPAADSKAFAPASSAAPEGQPSPADRAAAQALFDEGRELMEQGRPADACPRFEESARLEPGLGTRFHLATCYEALGKLASAHTLFLEVAAEAGARNQPARQKVARERAEAVEPRLSRLTIEVPFSPSPALRIERDGTAVGNAQWGLPIPVDPGAHHIAASAPGYEPWSAEVDVPEEPGVTRVNVPPLAERPQAFFAPLSRKLGLVALGVGAGALALGGVFTAQAVSKKNASDRAGCTDRDCPPNGLTLRNEALQAGDRATWAAGFGLLGLGAAATLFWVVPPSGDGEDEGDVQLSPVANLNGASLRLDGRF